MESVARAMPSAAAIWFFHSGMVTVSALCSFSQVMLCADWIIRICAAS